MTYQPTTWKLLSAMVLLSAALRGQAASGPAAPPPGDGVEYFEKHIRPVLVERCYECHATTKKVKGKLLVDSKEGLLKGGASGPAVVPGNVDKSLLITAIRYSHEDLQMPPKEPLTKVQIAAFEQWVKLGAPDPRVGGAAAAAVAHVEPSYDFAKAREFWSFKPVQEPAIPAVQNAAWPQSDIDRLLLAKMEAKGLTPVPLADKRTLIRRATYDLTGLPPTPQEVEEFVSDPSPTAFERVVERLLNSPAYGEKWGRQWLDVVRYADTSGCNSDFPVPDLYRYRNWVIKAYNADKPYDQFLKEQIAGDLMTHASVEERNDRVVATGYLANARRFGSRNNEFHLTIEDTIDNVGKAMLGLSVSCARCHDHKFDPIPASDYYAMYGIFASTKYSFPGTEIYRHTKDFVSLGDEKDAAELKAWSDRLAELDDKYEILLRERDRLASAEKRAKELAAKAATQRSATQSSATQASATQPTINVKPPEVVKTQPVTRPLVALATTQSSTTQPATKPVRTSDVVRAEMAEITAEMKRLEGNPPKGPKAYAVLEGKPVDAKIHVKGEPKILGNPVRRGFLTVLGGQKLPETEKGSGRLQLAEWIASPTNPLTARVMVNRIWQGHFGVGIVKSVNDFGVRGERPTHPELLDHLAAQFVRNGWSVKSMHRLIMLSRVYQLASFDDPRHATIDPANDHHWRFNPRRLAAEEIRDTILALAGTLDGTTGGPHPFPPETEWRYTQHRPFMANYDTTRRSVYLMQQRIGKQPFLATFDGADTNTSTGARAVSTTAIQALWMMNDPLVHDQSAKFASHVGSAITDPRGQIDSIYRRAVGRPASSDELDAGVAYVQECARKLAGAGVPADNVRQAALASFNRVIFASNEFLFVE